MKKKMIRLYFLISLFSFFTGSMFAGGGNENVPAELQNDNWIQYRSDSNRSGYTNNTLPDNLGLRWILDTGKPSPAWTGVHTRMTFDYANQVVVKDNLMFYGSSTDNQIHSVNIHSGEEVWSFFTDSPVRMSPVLYNDMLFAVSDDGKLYCLSAAKGELLWKKEHYADIYKLGNKSMVSSWPSRGGIALKNGIIYYGVGIWPTQGVSIIALDPETGNEIWKNEDTGHAWTLQPHDRAEGYSGVSAQGYLVVTDNHVLVPTGRAVPAAYDINSGELEYFHFQQYRNFGGSRLSATDKYLFVTSGNTRDYEEIIGLRNGIFNENDGHSLTSDDFNTLAASPNQFNSPGLAFNSHYLYSVDPTDLKLKAYDVHNITFSKTEKNSKGEEIINNYLNDPKWTIQTMEKAHSIDIIIADRKVIVGTANGHITIYDSDNKEILWAAEVEGIPYGLCVAQGKLFVSTDEGKIYCFDSLSVNKKALIQGKKINPAPYGNNELYKKAAKEILEKSGIGHGYCLDVNCGDGALAYELAKISNLHIIATDSNPANVALARKKLNQAGLYGNRVQVQLSETTLDRYPSYFANLIISGSSVKTGENPLTSSMPHVQRPYGGILITGKPGSMTMKTRGELEGAGQWTHMYSDPANTICSLDERVKGELGMLWWDDPDFDVPSRHGRGVAPLVKDGMLFMQGIDGIRAYDAYNGHTIWDYYIEDLAKHYDQDNLLGAAITGANYAIDGDKMYIRVGQQQYYKAFREVHVVDIYTGNQIKILTSPKLSDPGKSSWGDLNYWGLVYAKDGTLYGTITDVDHIVSGGYRESDMSHQYSESRAVFAMDPETSDVKWIYEAKNSIRHNTFSIGDNKVYFVDRPIASQDRLRFPSNESGLQKGELLCLDAKTGNKVWSTPDTFTTLTAVSIPHNILIGTQQYTRFKLNSEVGGKIIAYNASNGKTIWERNIEIGAGIKTSWDMYGLDDIPDGITDPSYIFPYTSTNKEGFNTYVYSSRPLIIEDEIFFEPWSLELKTGKDIYRPFARTYNCGILSSGKHMLTMRSGVFGYFNLDDWESGVENWGGFRPACWIHTPVANGLVLVPEGQARCDCSYLMLPSIAFAPKSDLSPNEKKWVSVMNK
ncbi:MAG: PQQ-binding-like beta-propeller repeat protein [Spirochaetales bacterium]|nr:PQQ-binding-like beta-propeller repeat protein [Spirochaetales bacterium]